MQRAKTSKPKGQLKTNQRVQKSLDVLYENRCLVKLNIASEEMIALIDSGADNSYLGKRGVMVCEKLGLPIQRILLMFSWRTSLILRSQARLSYLSQ